MFHGSHIYVLEFRKKKELKFSPHCVGLKAGDILKVFLFSSESLLLTQ